MEALIVETLMTSLMKYYGLDWLAFASGIAGMYLITKKHRAGFGLSALSSMSGFAVAAISLQFGYVFYNILLITLMVKGYREWANA